jgi:hypothetical protein
MSDDEVSANRELMREQVEDLIRHRLSFLPAIKQEIQHYLKVSQTSRQYSNLQKSLSILEQLPVIPEDSEANIVKIASPIFGKFERAKSIARVEILAICTNLEVGLNDWDIVKHLRKAESDIVDIWAANIIPDTHWLNFQLPARITVIHHGSHYQIVFGLGVSLDDFSTSITHMEVPNHWTDPLVESLRHLDLFQVQGEQGISLNGIFYELYTCSWVGESLIEFLNPNITVNKSFVEIEKALFCVAKTVVDEKGQQSEKDFLSIWQRCIAKSENA